MRSGFVAILGRPNAGKSTLINALIKEKIAITSYKAETTRNTISGILNREDLQIVFLDTPGIHEAKTVLGSYMNREALSQAEGVDVIYYICDARNGLHEEDDRILKKIKDKAPVFLLLNKIDALSKEELLSRTTYAATHYDFAEIIPISALKEENLEELLKTTLPYLQDGVLYYPQDQNTSATMDFRIAEIIREKILICCEKEVPHLTAVFVERMKETEKRMNIEAVIVCGKESHKGIIIGQKGKMLQKINSLASREIAEWLGKKVNLSLFVRVEEDWLNKSRRLFDLGYMTGNDEG
ncbi:MAG: GTPase Era [Erysipelotrichaceae bacterium]|nr:GTPase Era [Erysipelotrichaceae bacterium]